MLTPPIEVSAGEAFIDGDLDIEGDVFSATASMYAWLNRALSPVEVIRLVWFLLTTSRSAGSRQPAHQPASLTGVQHSPARDRAAVQYHYDIGNDFYALWLGRRMQYSCAYFHTGDEDLDTAQELKLSYICRKLRLQAGERLLDIGCGWGGLATFAAAQYGVRVLGVTLSENQVSYARTEIERAGLADRVQVVLKDYRELDGEPFDKVVSVGMFEHVGRARLPEYFNQVYRLLKSGGLFLNHGICRRASGAGGGRTAKSSWRRFVVRHIIGAGQLTQRHVFPDSQLIPVSEVNLAADAAGFEIRDVENLREHYALTVRRWVRRLELNEARVVRAVGAATYRTWRLYLAACLEGFESGAMGVAQTLLAKTDGGRSGLPLTRAQLYEA
jgi:cyclopropane-fatty-acyl-phospholipid synthase